MNHNLFEKELDLIRSGEVDFIWGLKVDKEKLETIKNDRWRVCKRTKRGAVWYHECIVHNTLFNTEEEPCWSCSKEFEIRRPYAHL